MVSRCAAYIYNNGCSMASEVNRSLADDEISVLWLKTKGEFGRQVFDGDFFMDFRNTRRLALA